MLSLQRLLSKGDRFFSLLEAAAEEAHGAVNSLIDMVKKSNNSRALDELTTRQRRNKRIFEEMMTLLCSAFVTPLEREDLEALASALYKIPKTVERFCERLFLAPSLVLPELFTKQIQLLEQAAATLCQMVQSLRHQPPLEKIKTENDELHHYEGEADKLILELLRDLYSGRYEPLQVLVLRDLFEHLEKIIDRCRSAGNVVFQIVLKNS
jgi:uncharacterized protein Yka (UPF0111/DUF47 family)